MGIGPQPNGITGETPSVPQHAAENSEVCQTRRIFQKHSRTVYFNQPPLQQYSIQNSNIHYPAPMMPPPEINLMASSMPAGFQNQTNMINPNDQATNFQSYPHSSQYNWHQSLLGYPPHQVMMQHQSQHPPMEIQWHFPYPPPSQRIRKVQKLLLNQQKDAPAGSQRSENRPIQNKLTTSTQVLSNSEDSIKQNQPDPITTVYYRNSLEPCFNSQSSSLQTQPAEQFGYRNYYQQNYPLSQFNQNGVSYVQQENWQQNSQGMQQPQSQPSYQQYYPSGPMTQQNAIPPYVCYVPYSIHYSPMMPMARLGNITGNFHGSGNRFSTSHTYNNTAPVVEISESTIDLEKPSVSNDPMSDPSKTMSLNDEKPRRIPSLMDLNILSPEEQDISKVKQSEENSNPEVSQSEITEVTIKKTEEENEAGPVCGNSSSESKDSDNSETNVLLMRVEGVCSPATSSSTTDETETSDDCKQNNIIKDEKDGNEVNGNCALKDSLLQEDRWHENGTPSSRNSDENDNKAKSISSTSSPEVDSPKISILNPDRTRGDVDNESWILVQSKRKEDSDQICQKSNREHSIITSDNKGVECEDSTISLPSTETDVPNVSQVILTASSETKEENFENDLASNSTSDEIDKEQVCIDVSPSCGTLSNTENEVANSDTCEIDSRRDSIASDESTVLDTRGEGSSRANEQRRSSKKSQRKSKNLKKAERKTLRNTSQNSTNQRKAPTVKTEHTVPKHPFTQVNNTTLEQKNGPSTSDLIEPFNQIENKDDGNVEPANTLIENPSNKDEDSSFKNYTSIPQTQPNLVREERKPLRVRKIEELQEDPFERMINERQKQIRLKAELIQHRDRLLPKMKAYINIYGVLRGRCLALGNSGFRLTDPIQTEILEFSKKQKLLGWTFQPHVIHYIENRVLFHETKSTQSNKKISIFLDMLIDSYCMKKQICMEDLLWIFSKRENKREAQRAEFALHDFIINSHIHAGMVSPITIRELGSVSTTLTELEKTNFVNYLNHHLKLRPLSAEGLDLDSKFPTTIERMIVQCYKQGLEKRKTVDMCSFSQLNELCKESRERSEARGTDVYTRRWKFLESIESHIIKFDLYCYYSCIAKKKEIEDIVEEEYLKTVFGR